MPRAGVTTAFATALAAPALRPCFFLAAQFKTETLYVWTGLYPITWDGVTWQGVGSLLGMQGISEDSEVNAKNVTLSLGCIPSDEIALIVNEIQRGLPAQVFLGLFEADGVTLIPNPVLAYTGRMDQPTINDVGDTCTVSVSVENALVDMNRSIYRRYTDADQQLDYPGDLGCGFVAAIQDYTVYFGQLPQSTNN
jgi:hypothetical protein